MSHIGIKKTLSQLLSHRRDFFPAHLPHQLKELFFSHSIFTFAVAAGFLFEPIYLYSIGYSLAQIMFFFCGVYAVYFVALPLGGKIVKLKGFEHCMIYGSFFMIFYYVFLLALQVHPLFVIPAAVSLAIQKAVYWPAYHADFAFFGQAGERGREVSNYAVLDAFMNVLGPVIGGILVSVFGFQIFFGFMCLVIIASNIPFLLTREIFKPSNLSYLAQYKTLLAKENRKYFFAYLGFGEELVAMTLWPVFLFVTFQSVLSTGAAVAISTIVTSLFLLYVGREADGGKDRKRVLRIGAAFTFIGWMLRIVVRGGTGVFLVDFLSRTSKGIFLVPMYSELYDYASKTALVRTVLFFELSLTVGKVLISGILGVFFLFYPSGWNIAFVLAGLFSLCYLVLSIRTRGVPQPIPISS